MCLEGLTTPSHSRIPVIGSGTTGNHKGAEILLVRISLGSTAVLAGEGDPAEGYVWSPRSQSLVDRETEALLRANPIVEFAAKGKNGSRVPRGASLETSARSSVHQVRTENRITSWVSGPSDTRGAAVKV